MDVLHQGVQDKINKCRDESCTLISFLHSNCQTIGQILLPHYRSVLPGISWREVAASARGSLIENRMFPRPLIPFHTTLPWMDIPYADYWHLCYQSIISSLE